MPLQKPVFFGYAKSVTNNKRFFYQSVDCTVSSDGEFAEAVLSSLSLVEPGSETSSSCSVAG